MRPDGVNGSVPAQQPSLAERIDNVNVSDTNQLSETLAGLTNEANQEIQKAFEDKRITQKESGSLNFLMSKFCSLNGRIKTAIKTAGEEIKNTYEQLSKNLDNTIERLTKASNGKNPDVAVQEPTETDAQDNRYRYLDKQADKLLTASIDEDKARINSEKAYAFNPYSRDRKPRPSGATIDKIKDLYMSTYSQDGKRVRDFAEPAKINQLLKWANLQYRKELIDNYTYIDLTKDAVAALDKIYSANNNTSDNIEDTTNNNNQKFWDEYQKIMQEQGHSHNGVADLGVLGYPADDAQALLDGTKKITRKPD